MAEFQSTTPLEEHRVVEPDADDDDVTPVQATRARRVEHAPLPPVGAILARPLLLGLCLVLGALVGLVVAGEPTYKATATITFFYGGASGDLLKADGQTMADSVTTDEVLELAAAATATTVSELVANIEAGWRTNTRLIDVTAAAAEPEAAVERVNAVANAMVDTNRNQINTALTEALINANTLLTQQALGDSEAETARRTQIGSSAGQRQEGTKNSSNSVLVSRAATEASAAGLTKPLGVVTGAAAGLLAGCVLSLLLGARGLRARTTRTIRRLAPDLAVATLSEAPQVAGQIVQAGETYLAVVVPPRSGDAAETFATDVESVLRHHGKTVTIFRAPATVDGSCAVLRADAPDNVRELVGTDVVIVVVEAGTATAAMLEGRSGFRTVVLIRRRTPISSGLAEVHAYRHSSPLLMLAR